MINGLHHISMHCHDLDRMIDFYSKAFGFEVVGDAFSWKDTPQIDTLIDVPNSAARGAMLRAGNCYMELFEFAAPRPTPGDKAKNAFDKGYTHMCIDCSEIEQEFVRLKQLGMTFGAAAPVDMGHVKSAYGRDPEGNLIELQETLAPCDFKLPKFEAFTG
jgi:glyoxylase I family protein